jgi:DivIVA domain-containing protein
MAITAQDIHNQSFSIDRKGYDVDEVDVFLEFVANEIDNLNKQIAQLESTEAVLSSEATTAIAMEGALESVVEPDDDVVVEQDDELQALLDEKNAQLVEKDAVIADLRAQLAEKAANDNAISQALIIAQRSADDIVCKANNDAVDIVQDAEDEAAKIVNRANNERERVADAIRKLEESREHARENYAELLKNFVADASRKLADLGYTDGSQPDFKYSPATDTTLDYVAEGAQFDLFASSSETTGQLVEATPAVAASYEKDLSGFGDAAEDFDDID